MTVDKLKKKYDKALVAVQWYKANIAFIENDSYYISNPAVMEKALQEENDKLQKAYRHKREVIALYKHALDKIDKKTEQCILTP